MHKKTYLTSYSLLLLIILFSSVAPVLASEIPRPEYPRPQFQRDQWKNLNGMWTFSFDFGNSGQEKGYHMSKGFDDPILVPFCPESKLSGVEYKDFINHIWYHREHSYDYEGEPWILDEFGGIKWNPSQQRTITTESWGYGSPPGSLEEHYQRLEELVDIVLSLEDCVGYCYTQLTDVESEQNGIYYYNRDLKFDMERIREIFSRVPERFNK